MKTLSRLRILFIIYFIIKMIIDIYLVTENKDALGDMSRYGIPDITIEPGTMMIAVVAVNLILLLIGLWLFSNLLNNKNWARVVLIIIGWLVVFDFLMSMMLRSKSVEMLNDFTNAIDWDRLILADIVSDLIGVVFWGYLIIMLQFNLKVRQQLFETK